MRLGFDTAVWENVQRDFDFFLSVLGPIMFLCFQYSCVITANHIREARSPGQFSQLPFLALFTNSFIWCEYALFRGSMTLFVPNFCGVLTGAYCVYHYETNSTKLLPMPYYYASLGVILLVLALGCGMGTSQTIGMIGDFSTIVMMGAPLAVLMTVLEEKSTRALPFMLVLCSS